MLTALPTMTIQQLSILSGGLKSDLQQLMEEILVEKDSNGRNFTGDY